MVHHAEETERLGGLVPQLVGLQRADAGDVEVAQRQPPIPEQEDALPAGPDDHVGVDVPLEARVATRFDLEVAQIRARSFPEFPDEFHPPHAPEGQISSILVGASCRVPPSSSRG